MTELERLNEEFYKLLPVLEPMERWHIHCATWEQIYQAFKSRLMTETSVIPKWTEEEAEKFKRGWK